MSTQQRARFSAVPSRYAELHRTIDVGIATDRTHADLTRVCAALGKKQEACSAVQNVRDLPLRRELERDLVRRGMLQRAETSYAGTKVVTDDDLRMSLAEQTVDAMRFLVSDPMPQMTIVVTLGFPAVGAAVVIGAASSWAVLIAGLLALVALLCTLGHLGIRIFDDALRGTQDPFPFPGIDALARGGLAFAKGHGPIFAAFLIPVVAVGAIGAPLVVAVSVFALALLFLPAAVVLFAARRDYHVLLPRNLWQAACRGGLDYVAMVGMVGLMLVPALGAWCLLLDGPVSVQLMVLGPLAVAPFFVAMRLLGSFVHDHPQLVRERRTRPRSKLRDRPIGGPQRQPARA